MLLQLTQRWDASAVAFDSHDGGSCVEKGAGQSTRTRPDFINRLTLQIARNRRNPRKKLPVEDEILTERLACAQPMTRN